MITFFFILGFTIPPPGMLDHYMLFATKNGSVLSRTLPFFKFTIIQFQLHAYVRNKSRLPTAVEIRCLV